MGTIADILMISGTFGAAFYCLVLQRRLGLLTSLEGGMGHAIALLSGQVDDLTRTLDAARTAAQHSSRDITELTSRADAAAVRLELLLSSLHDLPAPTEAPSPPVDRAEPTGTTRGPRILRMRSRINPNRPA